MTHPDDRPFWEPVRLQPGDPAYAEWCPWAPALVDGGTSTPLRVLFPTEAACQEFILTIPAGRSDPPH